MRNYWLSLMHWLNRLLLIQDLLMRMLVTLLVTVLDSLKHNKNYWMCWMRLSRKFRANKQKCRITKSDQQWDSETSRDWFWRKFRHSMSTLYKKTKISKNYKINWSLHCKSLPIAKQDLDKSLKHLNSLMKISHQLKKTTIMSEKDSKEKSNHSMMSTEYTPLKSEANQTHTNKLYNPESDLEIYHP